MLASKQPAGFFVLQRFETDPPGVLVRAVGVQDKAIASLTRGRDPIDDQVAISMTRVRGSGASVQETGHRFLDVENVGDDAGVQRLEYEAQFALRHLVARGDIVIVRITVTEFTELQAAEIEVEYMNMRTIDPRKYRKQVFKVRRPEEVANPR